MSAKSPLSYWLLLQTRVGVFLRRRKLYTHAHSHAHAHAHTHTWTHTHAHNTHTHTRTSTHTHTRTHTRTHTCTHTHTLTRTQHKHARMHTHPVTWLKWMSLEFLFRSSPKKFENSVSWSTSPDNFRWGEIFRTCPDRPWGSPILLYNGCLVFPGGKAADTHPIWRTVKERVEPYLYSPTDPSWPVLGWTLPLPLLAIIIIIIRIIICEQQFSFP